MRDTQTAESPISRLRALGRRHRVHPREAVLRQRRVIRGMIVATINPRAHQRDSRPVELVERVVVEMVDQTDHHEMVCRVRTRTKTMKVISLTGRIGIGHGRTFRQTLQVGHQGPLHRMVFGSQ